MGSGAFAEGCSVVFLMVWVCSYPVQCHKLCESINCQAGRGNAVVSVQAYEYFSVQETVICHIGRTDS